MSDNIIFFPECLFVMGTVCRHRQSTGHAVVDDIIEGLNPSN